MRADTRQRLLDVAEQLFAERGFYGVSIAAIANEMGFTKQGVLHYFSSKEKLYGTILQRVSDDFQKQQTEAEQYSKKPIERLIQLYTTLAEPNDTNTRRTRLLMRELLDNNARAPNTEHWYLGEFLKRLIKMVKAVENLEILSDEEALIFTYQLLGSINYFLISPTTLEGIFGEEVVHKVTDKFLLQTELLIDASVGSFAQIKTKNIEILKDNNK